MSCPFLCFLTFHISCLVQDTVELIGSVVTAHELHLERDWFDYKITEFLIKRT